MAKDRSPRFNTILKRIPKSIAILLSLLIVLLLTVVIASFFIDEPLRRYTERQANEKLEGYTVRIPKLSFHPLNLSLTLGDLSITQKKHPAPPVAKFHGIHAGIYWRSLFSGRLVAEMVVDRPVIHLNLAQLKEEARHPEPVRRKRWQEAVQSLYPLKINIFSIRNADVTYLDEKAVKTPLHVTKLNVRVSNIRNRATANNLFPSPFHIDAEVFGTGRATIDGNANILAEPDPTGEATFNLSGIELESLKPILARKNLIIDGGVLTTDGRLVYAPKEKIAEIKNLIVQKLKVDFILEDMKESTKDKAKAEVLEKAKRVENKPGVLLRIGRMELKECEVGLIDKKASPDYRVFMAGTDLLLTNLSNHFSQGPAKLQLTGKFMGSGNTKVTATFRPETDGPDFDLNMSIYGTKMKSMNNLLRAYGNFDVIAGEFSFYSELRMKNNHLDGYVKPLFRDLNVYDRRQDKEKSIFRKLYEGLIGGVAGLLENRPREAVATKTDISGPVDEPQVSTWQAVINVLRNAFFKAILPGFEKEVTRGRK